MSLIITSKTVPACCLRLQIYKLPPVAGARAAHPSVDSNYSQRIVGGPRHPEVITRLTFSPIGRQGYLAPRTLQGRHSSLLRESRGEKSEERGGTQDEILERNVLLKVLGLARGLWDPRPAGRDAPFVIYKRQVERRHATPRHLLAVMGRGEGGGLY